MIEAHPEQKKATLAAITDAVHQSISAPVAVRSERRQQATSSAVVGASRVLGAHRVAQRGVVHPDPARRVTARLRAAEADTVLVAVLGPARRPSAAVVRLRRVDPATTMRLIVLSDTHVGPKGKRDLPPHVWKLVEAADAVLHAGDIKTDQFLERLEAAAVTYAVAGNNDVDMNRPPPDVRHLELAGVSVGMIHDAGPSFGRARRMRRRFPDASLVVFGHSHVPVDQVGAGGQRLFNPGSPTLRRRQPHHTIGELVFDQGEITDHRIIVI